jgi:hypothetical protein
MIPKIIHYCWLSGDEFPPQIQKCIESWKKHLPDYEFMLWDTIKFDLDSNIWVKQAFENKKYAFAADYIRLYAVYNYGGIYMDTDVEVKKSFNDLLNRPYFIGTEGNYEIEAGIFGSERKSSWLKVCLEYYDRKTFIEKDGSFNITTLPKIMKSQILTQRSIKLVAPINVSHQQQEKKSDTLFMFPKDYFCAKNHLSGKIEDSPNTYTVHHFAMSWLPKSEKLRVIIKRKLFTLFGINIVNIVIHILGLRKLKRFFAKN